MASGGAVQLRVLGRKGDAVKIGGELVERSGLEDALLVARLALGLKSDAALRLVPDDRLGHRVELEVEDGNIGVHLQERLNALLPPYAHARLVRVVPQIDRTALGKQRREAGTSS
jgi:O-succinylbenzoic acid--CoA ligase